MSQPTFRDSVRGYPGRAFTICLIAYTFATTDLALFGYAIPVIRDEFGLTTNEMGWYIAASFAIGGILLSGIGNLTDRLGRKTMLVGNTIISSVFVALHAVAQTMMMLTIFRTIAFATGGALYSITGALMAEEAPARYRGIFAGLLQTGFPLGAFVASLFAAFVIEKFGWRALFLVGLISIPYVFVILSLLKETKRFTEQAQKNADHKPARISELFAPDMRRRSIVLFFAQLTFVTAYSSAIWFPTYFMETRGLDVADAAKLVGFGNLVAVLGYMLAAYVGEFVWSRKRTLVVWTMLGAVLFVVLIKGTTTVLQAGIVFALMSMFFYGTAAVKFAYVAEIFPTRLRATGLAVCGSLAVSLGQAIGPLLMAQVSTVYGWDNAMIYMAAVPLFIAGVMYIFLDTVPSGLEVEDLQERLNKS